MLAGAFTNRVADDQRVSDAVSDQVGIALEGSVDFVSATVVGDALAETALPDEEATAILDAYEDSQLTALRTGLFAAAVIVVAALFLVRRIPDLSFEEMAAAEADDEPEPEPSAPE